MRITTNTVYDVDLLTPEDAGNVAATATSFGMSVETFTADPGQSGLRLRRQSDFATTELAMRLNIEASIRGMSPRQVAEEALKGMRNADDVPTRLAYPDEPDEDASRDR